MELFNPKNLNRFFCTLNKTPLAETGHFSDLYYLLASQASTPFPEHSQLDHIW